MTPRTPSFLRPDGPSALPRRGLGRRPRTLAVSCVAALVGVAALAPAGGAADRIVLDGGPKLGSKRTVSIWAARAAQARADTPGTLGPSDALGVATEADGSRALRTRSGRRVLLRGVNVNGLVDYGGVHGAVGITAADGVQADALGLDIVRLGVSWSKVQPAPGTIDQAYLGQIESAARAFADRGIYVLLDMHHDRFAANLGQPTITEADGAPRWAVDTQGASCDSLSGITSYYTTQCAAKASESLWQNRTIAGRPLQDSYGDAVAAVAGVGKKLGPAFAGIELYNEPRSPEPGQPEDWAQRQLWPMYDRLIKRLRSSGTTAPIWFDSPKTSSGRFSADPNLVFAPHIYDDVFDRSPDGGTPARLFAAYDLARARARTFGAAAVVGEYAGARGGVWEGYRQAGLSNQERTLIGGIMWVWKQHPTKDYGWGLLKPDGALQSDGNAAQDLSRPRLVSAAPGVAGQTYDGTTLTVTTRGAGVVEVWDGMATGAAATRGRAPNLTVDGALPTARMRVRAGRATATVPGATMGGRRLRVTLPAGEHVLRLKP